MSTTTQVSVNDVRLRVSDEGEGPPLLLVTGLGSNLESWRPLKRLLPGRRIISFDAPGAGASPAMTRPWRMPQLATTVACLLDEVDCPQADVLGFSFGGALAQQFARCHPARVRRLVLVGSTPGAGGVQNPLAVMRVFDPRVVARLRERRSHEGLARLVGGETARCPVAYDQYETARLEHPPSHLGYGMQALALCGWTSVPWLHKIHHPTLVVGGDDDPLVPVINSRIFERLIPDCRRHIVEGGGHLLPIDQPETIASVIDDFLGERGAGASVSRIGARRRPRKPALAA